LHQGWPTRNVPRTGASLQHSAMARFGAIISSWI